MMEMSITGDDNGGVSKCYVFKSRLQEYAQKAGIPTPVYETVKEGPSHEPCFKSTVIVNNVRYDSLPGFFNRKAAEQSAAEIALIELIKSGGATECIPTQVLETGLCKNLLQEYAQKMNFAIPSYECKRQATVNKSSFSCTVDVGGIQYTGAAARTKKEAEIAAARTALLAIQSHAGKRTINGQNFKGEVLTVLPCKKKVQESDLCTKIPKPLKTKKGNFKRRWNKRRFNKNKGDQAKTNLTETAETRETGNNQHVTQQETRETGNNQHVTQQETPELLHYEQGFCHGTYSMQETSQPQNYQAGPILTESHTPTNIVVNNSFISGSSENNTFTSKSSFIV